jgi:RimJ/RimL family protein N-acetyltransferase
LQEQEVWFGNYEKDPSKKFFTICKNETPIGIIGLSNIHTINKNADLFIVIGEDEYRGKGYGKKAMEWILDFGFHELGLHKINLGVFEENESAIHLYKKLGFKTEGVMKDEIYFDDAFHNFLSMAIFKKDIR